MRNECAPLEKEREREKRRTYKKQSRVMNHIAERSAKGNKFTQTTNALTGYAGKNLLNCVAVCCDDD
jgi:hypothetical protein